MKQLLIYFIAVIILDIELIKFGDTDIIITTVFLVLIFYFNFKKELTTLFKLIKRNLRKKIEKPA